MRARVLYRPVRVSSNPILHFAPTGRAAAIVVPSGLSNAEWSGKRVGGTRRITRRSRTFQIEIRPLFPGSPGMIPASGPALGRTKPALPLRDIVSGGAAGRSSPDHSRAVRLLGENPMPANPAATRTTLHGYIESTGAERSARPCPLHTRTVPSVEPVITSRPSGLKATWLMEAVFPR